MKNKETMIFLSAARLEEQAAARITAERPVAFGRYPRARAESQSLLSNRTAVLLLQSDIFVA
jgi:hypothetical protein